MTSMRLDPFRIEVADSVLDDLRERLRRTRWPDDPGHGWRYGVPVPWLRELCDYWIDQFDWRLAERRLNTYPQFVARLDEDVPVHFLHVRGNGPDPVPLVLTVGWPSTFAEVLDLIPLLTDPGAHGGDPADAVDLVVPTIPGFGFSTPYTRSGPRPVHDWWATLMSGLGYHRFAASGTDIGARVTTRLGRCHPERMLGIHLASVDLDLPDPLPAEPTEEEANYLRRVERWELGEGGYAAIQRSRPQTLGYGLSDSPAGLAAWMLEKFHAWSEHRGDVYTRFGRDDLLTAVTVYWATGCINSANRHYFETSHDPAPPRSAPGVRVEVPTAVSMFPGEADLVVPRSLAERAYRLEQWTEPPAGGHFAAHEEPVRYAADLLTFLRTVR